MLVLFQMATPLRSRSQTRRSSSIKSFNINKVKGEWNEKTGSFHLTLPRGVLEVDLNIQTLDGPYFIKLDEYTNKSVFIPYEDQDYPTHTAAFRVEKQLYKLNRCAPNITDYHFPRRANLNFYNPSRPSHLPGSRYQQRPQSASPDARSTGSYGRRSRSASVSHMQTNPSAAAEPMDAQSPGPSTRSPRARSRSPLTRTGPTSSPTPSQGINFSLGNASVPPPPPTVCVNCHATGHTCWTCPKPVAHVPLPNGESNGERNDGLIFTGPSQVNTQIPSRPLSVPQPNAAVSLTGLLQGINPPQLQSARPTSALQPNATGNVTGYLLVNNSPIPGTARPTSAPQPNIANQEGEQQVLNRPSTSQNHQGNQQNNSILGTMEDNDCMITNYQPPKIKGFSTIPIKNTKSLHATMPQPLLEKLKNKQTHLNPKILVCKLPK